VSCEAGFLMAWSLGLDCGSVGLLRFARSLFFWVERGTVVLKGAAFHVNQKVERALSPIVLVLPLAVMDGDESLGRKMLLHMEWRNHQYFTFQFIAFSSRSLAFML
jgi:hypothetical protein